MSVAPVMAVATSTRSKTSAGLFALLLGGFGLHNFYLGQTAAGALYFLFWWTLIPSLIAFIEALVLFRDERRRVCAEVPRLGSDAFCDR